jgi:hypothetical protein
MAGNYLGLRRTELQAANGVVGESGFEIEQIVDHIPD